MFGIKLEDSAPSNIFAGVHFILLGFDPVYEQKVRLKLVTGGGVDVGHYGPVCSHVIVNKLVYNDPICVAARADGKVLVTGLWVDHSFDVGLAVDPTSVMYIPLKGRDGIPGAKSLIICLTGYQRQDRDDIMTMVGLMGANFSKPLIANKVTHLICYKFEGEKYELAKKMQRIKLVNHRWLEDCLKAWEILPEADYNKSGYELEMMEAEAKDSEEEDAAQEPGTNIREEMKIITSPNPTEIRVGCTPQTKENMSSASKYFPQVSNNNITLSATGEDNPSAKKINFEKNIVDEGRTGLIGHQDPLDLQGVTYDEPFAKTPTSAKVGINLASNFDVVNYSRKSVGSNTLSAFKRENKSLSSLSKGDEDKLNACDGFDNSFPRKKQSSVRTETGADRSPPKEEATPLSRKRKLDLSYGNSKSPKINSDSKSNSGSPSVSNLNASFNAVSNNNGVNKNASTSSRNTSPVNMANTSFSPKCKSFLNMAKENTYDIEPKSPHIALSKSEENHPSCTESEKTGSAIEGGFDNILEKLENASIEAVNPQRKQEDAQVPSPKDKNLGVDKSVSPLSDTSKEKDMESIGKSVRKKTIAKRTWNLGCRPKVALRKAKNQKGSIYKNDDVSASIAGIDDFEKAEELPLNNNKEMGTVTKNVGPLEKEHTDNIGYVDDETEAPEDIEENEFRASLGLEKSEETDKVNLAVEDRSECTIPSIKKADDISESTPYASEGGAKSENKSGKNGLDELHIHKGSELEKPTKSLDKNRKSVPSVSGKKKPKQGENKEESESKKNNPKMGENQKKSGPSSRAKEKETVFLEKPENSMLVEKDTRSVGSKKSLSLVSGKRKSKEGVSIEESGNKKNIQKVGEIQENSNPTLRAKSKETVSLEKPDNPMVAEKETGSVGNRKSVSLVSAKRKSKEEVSISKQESENKNNNQKIGENQEKSSPSPRAEAKESASLEKPENLTVADKEKRLLCNRKSVTLVSGKRKAKEEVSKEESKNKKNNQKMGENQEKSSLGNKKLVPLVSRKRKSKEEGSGEEKENKRINQKIGLNKEKNSPVLRTPPSKKAKGSAEVEKENRPVSINNPNIGQRIAKAASSLKNTSAKAGSKSWVTDKGSLVRALNMESEPAWFLLTGHKLQRREFQQVIKRLKGRVCRDSHKWSYQATHLIYPDPLRRTEKFFAAAASGRWILKTDYLAACNQARKFLAEEPYEWHKKCLSEDGAINLEAPRKWRLLREKTGHGAFYGMRVVIYGECIAPPLETLKRVIKAGDGTILATSPPYTRFLNSGVDYAIVSPGMPRIDIWVQEFIRNKIPCVAADYLVEYVCKPGYSLEKHVLYDTQAWAVTSFNNLQKWSEEIVLEKEMPNDDDVSDDDIECGVCGSRERGEVMLMCGDERGSFGCGVGMHIDCCDPPLECVPNDDWFCSKCSDSRKNKGNSRRSKKGRSVSKQK